MPQDPTSKALQALRGIIDAGGPQSPMPSHQAPSASMRALSPWEKFNERMLPMSDEEPLAQHGVLNALMGHGESYSPVPSMEDVGGMSPMMGTVDKVRPLLKAFKGRQPEPSATRMKELVSKFGGTLGSGEKQAAKGLTDGMQGFELPDGMIARPDGAGVNRIMEGNQATEALENMMRPSVTHQTLNSGWAPSVSDPSHLGDVSVPIADSLDTAATPKLPLSGTHNLNKSSRRTSVVNDTIVRDIRALHDTGLDLESIRKLHPDVPGQSVYEIAKRLSFNKVK